MLVVGSVADGTGERGAPNACQCLRQYVSRPLLCFSSGSVSESASPCRDYLLAMAGVLVISRASDEDDVSAIWECAPCRALAPLGKR